MDLLSVFRTFRRHWIAALPVIVLTVACLAYAVFIRPTDYEATASVALLSPPGAPRDETGEPIEATPAGKTNSPLARFTDQTVVVNIVSKAISTDAFRDSLEAQGADTRYEVGPGISGPIADITAIASTPEDAITTAQLVAAAFVSELQTIQAQQGVDPTFMISTLPVEEPENAKPKLSSTFRLAIAVLGLGVIATFFVVSLAEARSQSRKDKRERATADAGGTGPEPDEDDDRDDEDDQDDDEDPAGEESSDTSRASGTSGRSNASGSAKGSPSPPPWGGSSARPTPKQAPKAARPLRGR